MCIKLPNRGSFSNVSHIDNMQNKPLLTTMCLHRKGVTEPWLHSRAVAVAGSTRRAQPCILSKLLNYVLGSWVSTTKFPFSRECDHLMSSKSKATRQRRQLFLSQKVPVNVGDTWEPGKACAHPWQRGIAELKMQHTRRMTAAERNARRNTILTAIQICVTYSWS